MLSSVSGLEVIGEAGGTRAAIRVIERVLPDLVTVDISLNDGDGLDLIKQIRSRFPSIRMLVLSMHDELLYANRSLDAGAHGYISKHEEPEAVIKALRTVLDGKLYLSEEMQTRRDIREPSREDETSYEGIELLSDRELQIFELIGQGLSTKKIATHLVRSPKTIETHRDRIKVKLGIQSTQELSRRAFLWSEREA